MPEDQPTEQPNPSMASNHLQPETAPTGSEEDTTTPQDSASQCGSSTSMSSSAQRAADRATTRLKQALLHEKHAMDADEDEEEAERLLRDRRRQRKREAFEAKSARMLIEAEDDAINKVEAEEAGQANAAPPATPATTTPISLAPPSTPAMPLHTTVSAQLATGGAIPKRPPPGLPSPPVTSVLDNLDNLRAPSASYTGVGARGADTTVLDTVLPGPALGGGVSVPTPAPGYGYVGYYPESRRWPPTNMYVPPVVTAREQPPGNSAPCTDTRSDSTGPCNNNQLAQLIGVLQAPAVIIPTFSGDPMSYQRFIRDFEDNVERVISDDASRLARLAQQCEGEAARIIECCMLMPPELGYPRARELLRSLFGDEIIIVDLWVRRLVGENRTVPLQEYADNLRSCYEALTAMDSLTHLDNSINLPKLVQRLPGYLQSRWRGLALQLRKERTARRPALADLIEFTQDAALEANDPPLILVLVLRL